MKGPGWLMLDELVAALRLPEYGTSMHYPGCLGGCTGCVPPVRVPTPRCAPAVGVHTAACECDS